MTRGEIWMSQIGRKVRPVLVLTRTEVLDVRTLVTVAEITAAARGLAAEVELNSEHAGLELSSVVNCDGLHTVPQSALTRHVGAVDDTTLRTVCWAVNYALGC